MTLHVFTYKEGVLSSVAHDLRLTPARLDVARDGDRVIVRVGADSLRVDGVMRHGALDAKGLSEKDRREIEQTVRDTVLETKRWPEIRFEGDATGAGSLTLHGRTLPVRLSMQGTPSGEVRGEVELVPSRWGVVPYRAMLGALKVQDRVRITFSAA